MRILHVVPYYEQAWAYGGIPRVAAAMTHALARRGHHVTVCTTDVYDEASRLPSDVVSGLSRPSPDVASGFSRTNIDVRVFRNISNRLAYHFQFYAPVGLFTYLRRNAGAFDVAHLHACHNLPVAIAARILVRAGVPYVLSPNGTAPPIERRILAKRIFAATAGRHVLRDAARVLAVTAAEREQLLTLGIDAARIAIVPNPIDERELATPRASGAFRHRHGIDRRPLVLLLGKLTPRKGVDVLLQAFGLVRAADAALVIAGNDMGAGADALAARFGLCERVIHTGLLRGPDRLDALHDADVVVYPSRDEVFGLVPIEALCCGTPVVVSNDSGCGEVIARIGGGLTVPYGDPSAVAGAIELILAARDEWRNRAAAAADRARALFASDVVADELERLYVEIAPATVPAGPIFRSGETGVSFVVPIHNGRRYLRRVLDAILAQRDGRPFEVIAVDDRSSDGSLRLLREYEAAGLLRVIRGEGRGAAAAINAGIREAVHPIICQIDQDVVLGADWLAHILPAFDDSAVAAAQGHYVTADGAGFWAASMGRDLEHRYARIRGDRIDHVCTGNTAYRATALHQAGLLDETLGYGYDNDLSYRLAQHGYALAFCRRAKSVHRWREGFAAYMRQQFGVGYGRLDVVARHPKRMTGDDVSDAVMMAHAPAMLIAVLLLAASVAAGIFGLPAKAVAIAGGAVVATLGLERFLAGIAAWRRTGDRAALGFCIAHLARNLAWAAAIVTWFSRRAAGRRTMPADSMPRQHAALEAAICKGTAHVVSIRLLVIVPAFNEAPNLPPVVGEIRRVVPSADILVVNDGSTDSTPDVLPSLGVAWLTLPERVGVGGAVRVGLRYAHRAGYEYVARVDGDGQHRASDIPRLFAPVTAGRADAVLGSRFLRGTRRVRTLRRLSQAMLGACLTLLTGRAVTDPTSGFWAFGPRAVRLLARHYPTGYSEPELLLLLHRNALGVAEVPIRMRRRLAGRTSLTAPRAALATARTMLALLVVPLRDIVEGQPGD